MESDATLLFSFTDQSDSFVHGFEAGMIHVAMQSSELEIDRGYEEGFPIHSDNLETLARMAASYGYEMEHRPTDYPEWTAVRFKWRGGKQKPKLALV